MGILKQLLALLAVSLVALGLWSALDERAPMRLIKLGFPPSFVAGLTFFGIHDASATSGGSTAAVPSGQAARRRGAEGPVLVVVARVSSAVTNDRVTAIGTAEAGRAITLYPQAEGKIRTLEVLPGARVEAEAVIATLDDEAEKIALDRATLALQEAEARLSRYERLTSTLSTVERDTARSQRADALLDVRQAKLALERRKIIAPFAGVIGLINVELGQIVSSQTAIATLDDRAKLKLNFRIPEFFAARVQIGQVFTATTPSRPNEEFSGQISALASRIEADSRTLLIEGQLDNAKDLLRPGMSFLMTLRFPGDPYFSVPAPAVQWDREGPHVWRVQEGKAERIAVTLVERSVDSVLVSGPLAIGENVVVEGVQRLRPGSTVTVEAASPGEAPAAAGS